MKTVAIILTLLALIAAGCLGYALFNTDLHVVGKSLEVLPAAQRTAEFDALKTAVQRQSLLGTVLKTGEIGAAEDYSYYIYMHNNQKIEPIIQLHLNCFHSHN